MKNSSAKNFRSWLCGALLLCIAPFSAAHAATVAVDSLLIDYASLIITITGDGTSTFSGVVAPPVQIDMGTYQDPIVQVGSGYQIAKIYSTAAYGMSAPSGSVDTVANTINVDFSSLRASAQMGLYTLDFAVPVITNPPSAGSYDSGTGAYALVWSDAFSLLVGGYTITGIATVSLSGTATLVPVPAALWLLGSGLIGLAGLSRRRSRRVIA